jgi:O-antigen ligase
MSRSSDAPSRFSLLEKITLIHVTVLLLASAWLYGGNIGWARLGLSIWGSFSVPITLAAISMKSAARHAARKKAWWLIPPALYAALVVAGTFNPSFREITSDGVPLLIPRGDAHAFLPGVVNAEAALRSLWFGAGVYLAAFNLALVVQNRAALRFILIFLAANTLVLSVFGTLQALSSAGYYFGSVESPNIRFFATFIYNNHWGAFMILGLATSIALLFYHARRVHGRDLWHSPFSAALIGVLFIAATAPVSASRAATGMAVTLLSAALVHALVRIVSARRHSGRSSAPPLLALLALVIAASGAIGWLGYRSINARYVETRSAMETHQSLIDGRLELYRDTWTLASQKPLFGWGLDSYATAFQLIRPRPVQTHRQYESSYTTAHNDWLQSIAETGFVGTGLLLLTLALPLAGLGKSSLRHPLIAYPVGGLALTLLYAAVEFPFASAAFLITFWTLVFTLIRYAELTAAPNPS